AEGLHRGPRRLRGGRAAVRRTARAREGKCRNVETPALDRSAARLAAHADRQDPAVRAPGTGIIVGRNSVSVLRRGALRRCAPNAPYTCSHSLITSRRASTPATRRR